MEFKMLATTGVKNWHILSMFRKKFCCTILSDIKIHLVKELFVISLSVETVSVDLAYIDFIKTCLRLYECASFGKGVCFAPSPR